MILDNSHPVFRPRRRPRRRTRNRTGPSNKPEDEGRCAEYDDEYELTGSSSAAAANMAILKLHE